jgi:hypothetical protein
MPKATGLNGGDVLSDRPWSCATGTPSPSGAVAGVADGKQVGRRVERPLNRILDAERFRDRRLAASFANFTAPDRGVIGEPKPRRHVGGV